MQSVPAPVDRVDHYATERGHVQLTPGDGKYAAVDEGDGEADPVACGRTGGTGEIDDGTRRCGSIGTVAKWVREF